VVFSDVGTALRVRAATLWDGQIQLRLTPRISYFSVERPGAIDFTEAATELIVPNGQPVSLGGATSSCMKSPGRFSDTATGPAAVKPAWW
jgi:type II secretory pathway component GspD/PulD (secretin)